jgi:hypothetical protein
MDQVWVLRPPQDKWKPYAIIPSIPSGRISIMVWAAFSGVRRSDLIVMGEDDSGSKDGVTGRIYLDLLQNQLPTLLDEDSIFMHDNAPIYTFKQVTEWLKDMDIEVLDWPPYSPDLNPIEHQCFL